VRQGKHVGQSLARTVRTASHTASPTVTRMNMAGSSEGGSGAVGVWLSMAGMSATAAAAVRVSIELR